MPLTGHVDRNAVVLAMDYLNLVVPLTGHVDRNLEMPETRLQRLAVVPLTGHVDRNSS